MQAALFLAYLKWHFFNAPKELLKTWGTLLWFAGTYFSVGLLLRTYFAPWRRITWGYGRGFDLGRFLFTFSSNLISRALGAIMRTFLIGAGLFAVCGVLLAGSALLAAWIFLPAVIGIALAYGFLLLF